MHSNRKFAEGRIIEEGAELIGSFHTKWLTLAREFGLAMVSRMEPPLYKREGLGVQLMLDGQRLDQTTLDQLDKDMDEKVLTPLAELASLINDPSEPWGQLFLMKGLIPIATPKALDMLTVEEALPKFCKISKRDDKSSGYRLHTLLWKMLDFKLVNDEVAPLKEMNFLGLLCKVRAGQGARLSNALPKNLNAYWDELEIFRCADGCDALAKKLESAINTTPQKTPLGHVYPNEAVTQIDFSDGGAKLWLKATMTRDDGPYKDDVHFKDDKPARLVNETFSHVILATPPSVWPRITITVNKQRVDLAKTIGPLNMNDAVKFFSKFKKRFWIHQPAAPSGGATRLGQVWEGTDNQTQLGEQPVVLSVFAGPISDTKHAPKLEEFEKRLTELFPAYASHLIRPTLFSNWPMKTFIKAGYWSPLRGEIFAVSQKLTESHFGGRLRFAGEHTDTGFFGYMEGALRSGERAANSLMLRACGLPEKSASEPLHVAEFGAESPWLGRPDTESIDETEAPDGQEAVPMWNESEEGWAMEDEQSESFDNEDLALPGAEVNTESAAEVDDEQLDTHTLD